MKAKRITALLTALALTAALFACSKRSIELAQSGTENETESKISKETKETTEEATEETTEKITEEVTEAGTEAVSEIVPETETVPEVITEMATEIVTEKVTETPTEKQTEKVTNPPVVQTQAEAAVPVNVHTHSWKDHTATTQTWIPNMVTVDDYEDQVKEIWITKCDCGAEFYDDYGGKKIQAHFEETDAKLREKCRQEGRNWTADELTCMGFILWPEYETERVKVGSHTEDHGHYEESTYVDYQYCDCGATK